MMELITFLAVMAVVYWVLSLTKSAILYFKVWWEEKEWTTGRQ